MLDFWLGVLNSKNATSNVKKSGQPFYDSFYFLTDNVNSNSISAEAPLSEVHQKNETRKGQKSQVYHRKKKLGFLTKIKSCNESQVGKNEDDLFGQIITKFLSKISNWEIEEETQLDIQKLLFQAK